MSNTTIQKWGYFSMKPIHLKRAAAVLAVAACAAMGTLLFVPAAEANVSNPPYGSQPGDLTLIPASSTDYDLVPAFQTSTPCPASYNAAAIIALIGNDGSETMLGSPLPPTAISVPFSGSLGVSINDILRVGPPAVVPGQTFEIAVDCRQVPVLHGIYVQSTLITFPVDHSSAWSTSIPITCCVFGTATVLTGPSTVGVGGNATLQATVHPGSAVGSVQFLDGSTLLGTLPVSGGTAEFSTTSLTVGSHTITAEFAPTDPSVWAGSTSNPITVSVDAGTTPSETIDVNVPTSEGPFIMTVSAAPVNLSTATLSSDYSHFSASGTLGDITISDERNQTAPGWRISGQIGNFPDGTHTIPGNDLGWTPAVKTQNPSNDVIAGPAVGAGVTPGLTESSVLATADANKGLHISVLSAALDFEAPASTQPAVYSTTLTITAVL